ncbi:uncharacterized protein METZ01_LOCUS492626, partial [marine metagenome]
MEKQGMISAHVYNGLQCPLIHKHFECIDDGTTKLRVP